MAICDIFFIDKYNLIEAIIGSWWNIPQAMMSNTFTSFHNTFSNLLFKDVFRFYSIFTVVDVYYEQSTPTTVKILQKWKMSLNNKLQENCETIPRVLLLLIIGKCWRKYR